jgi:hypothetical protein
MVARGCQAPAAAAEFLGRKLHVEAARLAVDRDHVTVSPQPDRAADRRLRADLGDAEAARAAQGAPVLITLVCAHSRLAKFTVHALKRVTHRTFQIRKERNAADSHRCELRQRHASLPRRQHVLDQCSLTQFIEVRNIFL